MRCVVTGSEGFIGQQLVPALLARGDEVHCVDPADPGSKGQLPEGILDVGLADWMAEVQPHLLFHLAGQTDDGASMLDPVADVDLNVAGTVRVVKAFASTANSIAEAGQRRRPKLVFPGSWLMYGGGGPHYGEVGYLRPRTVYGASKAAAVRYLEILSEAHDFDYAVPVLGNVYGPGGDNVVSTLARRQLAGRDAWVFEQDSRDFVYVDDVAAALVAAGDAPGSQLCNVASGTETKLEDLWWRLAGPTGHGAGLEVRPGGRRCWLNVGHARAAWGWQPVTKLAAGLREVVAFEQAAVPAG